MSDIIYTDENRIIIQQRMSGTGSICDLSSDQQDIEINMGEFYQYVVVLPAFYNCKPTRCQTREAAKKKLNWWRNKDYASVSVLDRKGNDVTAYMNMER